MFREVLAEEVTVSAEPEEAAELEVVAVVEDAVADVPADEESPDEA